MLHGGTNYNVLVADQNLPNNSVVSIINTNVTRFGDDYDANVTGAFLSLKNKSLKKKKYFCEQKINLKGQKI